MFLESHACCFVAPALEISATVLVLAEIIPQKFINHTVLSDDMLQVSLTRGVMLHVEAVGGISRLPSAANRRA